MKKFLFTFFVALLLFGSFLPFFVVRAETASTTPEVKKVEYVLFHLTTCPHCRDEIKFINNTLMPKYGQYIDLKMYEVSSADNQKLYEQYGKFYNVQTGGVPLSFIDGQPIFGYGSDSTTGRQIMEIVESKILSQNVPTEEKVDNSVQVEASKVTVPLLGEIDPLKFSLPLLTVIIGLLDGFNPCAMWVLLFLITLLLGMENKKRMWLLGSIFIFASGLVYFIFMAAWLNLIIFIGMIFAIRVIIGVVAVGVGSYNLRDWWLNRKAEALACKVSDLKNTKQTFEKIKNIVYRKNIWWSIIGIVILGFSVNLVEMACSAGFPAVYTQVLALSGLPMWERYLYMFGYIIFYMLDDMVVFVLAMMTLQSKMVGVKYAKYANLVGGILILILGILLIFKPEWIMLS